MAKEARHVLQVPEISIAGADVEALRHPDAAIRCLHTLVFEDVRRDLHGYDRAGWHFSEPGVSSSSRAVLEDNMVYHLAYIERNYTREQVLRCIFRYPYLWRRFWSKGGTVNVRD